jgi:hypothetical protein
MGDDLALTRQGGPSALWPAIALFGLVSVISCVYGFQYLVPSAGLTSYFAVASVPFAVLLAALTWKALGRHPEVVCPVSIQATLGFVLMSASVASTIYFWSSVLRPVPWGPVAAGTVIVAWLCHKQWGARGSTYAYTCVMFLFFSLLIWRVPHAEGANMLEIIEAGSRELIAGRNPFRPFPSIAGDAPFGYLPALWAPYIPIVWLGLDVRILNLALLAALIVLFERGFPWAIRPETLAVTFYPLAFCSTFAAMIAHGHVWTYWLYIGACGMLLLRKRYTAASIFFGLALAARQPALFLVAPLAVFLYCNCGLLKTVQYAAIALGVYALLIAPALLWAGPAFIENAYLKLADIIKLGDQDPFLGAQAWLDFAGMKLRMVYMQLALIGAAAVAVSITVRNDAVRLLLLLGAAYSWLVFTAFYSIRYEYIPGFLLISIALSALYANSPFYHRSNSRGLSPNTKLRQ